MRRLMKNTRRRSDDSWIRITTVSALALSWQRLVLTELIITDLIIFGVFWLINPMELCPHVMSTKVKLNRAKRVPTFTLIGAERWDYCPNRETLVLSKFSSCIDRSVPGAIFKWNVLEDVQNGQLLILIVVWRKSIDPLSTKICPKNDFDVFVHSDLHLWPFDLTITPPSNSVRDNCPQNINLLSCSNTELTKGMWQIDRQDKYDKTEHFRWWNVCVQGGPN